MDFKIDENLPLRLIDLLKRYGHRSESVFHQKLIGKADTQIANFCVKEKKILVTGDLDFSNIQVYSPRSHPGIIVFRLRSYGAEAVSNALERFLKSVVDIDRLRGNLTIVEEARFRIRSRA